MDVAKLKLVLPRLSKEVENRLVEVDLKLPQLNPDRVALGQYVLNWYLHPNQLMVLLFPPSQQRLKAIGFP